MTTITAEVVKQTRNFYVRNTPPKVLTTFLLRYPRWIHSEFMTHRVFSRNSASSRAIKTEKLIADVVENPAVPLFWGKEQRGMQARESHDGLIVTEQSTAISAEAAWLRARDAAVRAAEQFAEAGYHKQVVNRLLEPFAHITVVASATELDNFFALRDHEDAEPHFQMLARAMKGAMGNSVPDESRNTHLPFVTPEEATVFRDEVLVKMSVARCASTSFKTVDGFDMTPERAVALYDRLSKHVPKHASPLEHVALRDVVSLKNDYETEWVHQNQHGNFVGFRQLRHVMGDDGDISEFAGAESS